MPVSNLVLMEVDTDDNPGKSRIFVTFTPSPTPDINRYVANCADSACKEAVISGTENSITIDVSSSCGGITYTVSIWAVDRREIESRMVTESVEVKAISGNVSLHIHT